MLSPQMPRGEGTQVLAVILSCALLCDLKQATEAFRSSVFPLQKALNNPSHVARGMNRDLTAGSNDKSQYSKEMP